MKFEMRINDISVRNIGDNYYEFTKIEPGLYYGKLDEYIDNGWVVENGFVSKDHTSIQLSIFNKKECHCNFCTMELGNDSIEFKPIGSRLIELSDEQLLTFKIIAKQLVELLEKEIDYGK